MERSEDIVTEDYGAASQGAQGRESSEDMVMADDGAAPQGTQGLVKGVVKLFVAKVDELYQTPWKRATQLVSESSGFIVKLQPCPELDR